MTESVIISDKNIDIFMQIVRVVDELELYLPHSNFSLPAVINARISKNCVKFICGIALQKSS